MDATAKIERLQGFQRLLERWQRDGDSMVRARLNQDLKWVRQEVIEAGCSKRVTLSPPPMIGGLIMHGLDPFQMIFNAPYGTDIPQVVIDMIDETIGVLRSPPQIGSGNEQAWIQSEVVENYAFVAMPMDDEDPALADVLDAIKEACHRCGVRAERIDDVQTNERITDRILESLKRAEFVIADLTQAKPNVYFEAGYAHALGKTPVYIARGGTRLEFDLKDFPVIFFKSLKDLKTSLEQRLRALAETRSQADRKEDQGKRKGR